MTQHPATQSIEQLLEKCEIKKTRRGGPGGQHRNKVESAIVITHLESQIIGQASERRSQHENRAVAIERLRQNLALAIRLPVPADQLPSELWRTRVRSKQFSVSLQHADFPAMLAEALDFIAAAEFDVSAAAQRLGTSSSQLIKFLKTFPTAFQWLNQMRSEFNLRPLR